MEIVKVIRRWSWRQYTSCLFSPKNIRTMRLWKWVYNRLSGDLTFRTSWGLFGLFWKNFLDWDFYLGKFCKVTFSKHSRTYLIGFWKQDYEDRISKIQQPYYYYYWEFGHTCTWIRQKDYHLVPVSEWHWGRYRPYAPKANVVKTGKILGIGYGAPLIREPLFTFKNPPHPSITSEFVEKNAWYVCSCKKEETCPGNRCEYPLSESVVIPCRPRRFLRPNDIVIFFDYQEDESDRYLPILKADIQEWKRGRRSLLPSGVVVRLSPWF